MTEFSSHRYMYSIMDTDSSVKDFSHEKTDLL